MSNDDNFKKTISKIAERENVDFSYKNKYKNDSYSVSNETIEINSDIIKNIKAPYYKTIEQTENEKLETINKAIESDLLLSEYLETNFSPEEIETIKQNMVKNQELQLVRPETISERTKRIFADSNKFNNRSPSEKSEKATKGFYLDVEKNIEPDGEMVNLKRKLNSQNQNAISHNIKEEAKIVQNERNKPTNSLKL